MMRENVKGGSDATTEEHFDSYCEGCTMRMWVEMSRASMTMHAYEDAGDEVPIIRVDVR